MAKIYSLSCDRNDAYDKNEDYDGQIVGDKYGKMSYVTELNHIPPWSKRIMPEIVTFITENEERLNHANYPTINTTLDVLSCPLIETIQSVGPVDWTLAPANFIDKQGNKVSDGHFKIAYPNEHCDCFDYEHSDYEEMDFSDDPPDRVTERMLKEVAFVTKLVIRKPENGFPPYFRILADPMQLYISEACHDAIVNAGHTGLKMIERADV